MSRRTTKWIWKASLLAVVVLALAVGGMRTAAAAPGLSTDKADYQPGDTVVITGTGFNAGASLTVRVTWPPEDGRVDSASVAADSGGGFVHNYALGFDAVAGTYFLDVLDTNGTVLASTTFTDSHFRFGHVTWTRAPGTRNVTFVVTQAWRSTACSTVTLRFGDGFFSSGVGGPIIATLTDSAGFAYCVRQTTVAHTYATDGPFTARFGPRCCRISGLVNASSASFRVETDVDLRSGNLGSPVSSIPPLLQMIQGVNSFALPIADPDGDTITCRMSTFAESRIPSVALAGAQVLAVTPGCVLNWDASAAPLNARYAVQVMIEENRPGLPPNDVALDFIIEIVGGVANQPPNCTLNGSAANVIGPGQAFSISATGDDPDGGNLTINHLGLPPGATLTPVAGTSGAVPFIGTFDWTPTVGDVGSAFAVSIIFTDPGFFQAVCSFSVTVTQVDNTPPRCDVTAVNPAPPATVSVKVQDSGSGVVSIEVLTLDNATVEIPVPGALRNQGDVVPFASITSLIDIEGVKIVQANSSTLRIRVTDGAGNVTECDPVLVSLSSEPGSRMARETVTSLPHADRYLTLYSDDPSDGFILVTVNNKWFAVLTSAGTIDVGSALVEGFDNTITLWGWDAEGLVMISDMVPPHDSGSGGWALTRWNSYDSWQPY